MPTDGWFSRTYPIKAQYNDYGSIENYKKNFQSQLWLDGFQKDLVEMGLGDNKYHDTSTSKDMTFEHMLDAVQEGRVLVSRRYDEFSDLADKMDQFFKKKVSPGIPTKKRISKIIEKAGLPILEKSGLGYGFTFFTMQRGQIKISWEGSGDNYGKNKEWLEKLKPFIDEKYVSMIRAPYRNNFHEEMIVCVKPGTKDWHGNGHKDNTKPLSVQLIMIREDVWQELLSIDILDHENDYDYNYKEQKKFYEANKQLSGIDFYRKSAYDSYKEVLKIVSKNDYRGYELEHLYDKFPGSFHLATFGGIPYGNEQRDSFKDFLKKKDLTEDEIKDFLNIVAESNYVMRLMHPLRKQWWPIKSCGPQFDDFKMGATYNSKIGELAKKLSKEQEEEYAEH